MTKPCVGAQLYTVRQFTKTAEDFKNSLKKIRKAGYSAVQISAIGPIDPKDVARILDDTEIICAATHVGWGRFLGELDAVIEEHKMWNCSHAAIGGLPKEYRTEEGIKKFVDELVPVAEKLSAEGLDFSYHNHNHELAKIGGETWLKKLYDLAPPEALKAEIDTYWITAGGGDPAKWVRDVAGRIPLLHLKDMVVKMPEHEVRMAEIGEGNLNWPAILEVAKGAGVEWYLVEQDNCYERDPFESLKISYDNLNSWGLS